MSKNNESKKSSKTKDPSVIDLAADILNKAEAEVDETDVAEIPEMPEISELPEVTKVPPKSTYGAISSEAKEVKEPPKPVAFKQGMFKDSAFVIRQRQDEVYMILAQHFGGQNGDYFIVNENTSTTYKAGRKRRYKCMLVEDKNGFRYGLWFDLTNVGPVF